MIRQQGKHLERQLFAFSSCTDLRRRRGGSQTATDSCHLCFFQTRVQNLPDVSVPIAAFHFLYFPPSPKASLVVRPEGGERRVRRRTLSAPLRRVEVSEGPPTGKRADTEHLFREQTSIRASGSAEARLCCDTHTHTLVSFIHQDSFMQRVLLRDTGSDGGIG